MVFQITSSPDPSEIGALFTADNVLGHGTAVFEDLQLYLDSLNIMKKRVVDAIAVQQQDNPPNSSQQQPQHSQATEIGGGPNTAAHTSSSTSTSTSVKPVKRAYPGHGMHIDDAVLKLDEYMTHRRMREEEALNVLKYGTVKPPHSAQPLVHDSITTIGTSESEASDNESSIANLTGAKEVVSGKEWESIEMVKVIYRHYPENLWEPAERGLLMVLEKLRKDGRVVNVGAQGTGKGRWRVSEKATL